MDTLIKGAFVTLRPLSLSDASITLQWRQSSRAIFLNRGAQTHEEQERWISSRPMNEYNFIICLQDDRPVGMVSLSDIDLTHRRAEPGRFLIGEEELVRGIPVAAESMKLLYTLAFEKILLLFEPLAHQLNTPSPTPPPNSPPKWEQGARLSRPH